MRPGRRPALPTISPTVLRDAAKTGAPIGVFISAGDRRPVAETVCVLAVEDETARIKRNGVEEVVDLNSICDPQAIRRRLNGDSWFSRLLEKISWM